MGETNTALVEQITNALFLVSAEDRNTALEQAMLKEPQVDCPVIHRFGPGIYIREVFLPADTFAVGHKQRTEHLNIFLTGKVVMLDDEGNTDELVAPMIFVSPPGRKVGYIVEDVVWLNVYSTSETDVEILENIFLDKSGLMEDEIKHLTHTIDNQDYVRVLEEYGFDEVTARSQSENTSDQMEFPYGGYKVAVSKSDIEGRGLFATATIVKGEEIAPARLGGKRTPAGVYTNHSISPNAEMVERGEDIYLCAIKDIVGCAGGFLGEEITINYRQALNLQIGELRCRE